MKKIALLLVLVIVVASMSVLLFACSYKVEGKSYVLDSVSVTAEGASDEYIAQAKTYVENSYKDAVLTFKEDGVMVTTIGDNEQTNYYVQDGDKIYVSDTKEVDTTGDPEMVIEDKKLVWKMNQERGGITFVITVTIKEKE